MGLPPVLIFIASWLICANVHGHGGIPPSGVPGYPNLNNAPTPNRLPQCENLGANGACGRTSSCLQAEAAQALTANQNRYAPGQQLQVPWLLSVVHGNGNLFKVRLHHSATDMAVDLLSDFPQGDNRSTGEVLAIGPITIPAGFPNGAAVLEAMVETGGDPYYDCLDVHIMATDNAIFDDGFEAQ